jgi:hypothetical protein
VARKTKKKQTPAPQPQPIGDPAPIVTTAPEPESKPLGKDDHDGDDFDIPCCYPIVSACVGPEPTVFAIMMHGSGLPTYEIHGVPVSREVYLDALATANADRWYPGWKGEPIPSSLYPQVVFDAMKVN